MQRISGDLKGAGAAAGVYVGRFSPMHLGHQAMIASLIDAYGDRHVVFIGSCNRPTSFRHLFTYEDRKDFIRAVFPNANIAPLPDFGDDRQWFGAMDDMLRLSGIDPAEAAYLGGSREDVEFYYENGRQAHIVNRYGGTTPNVSASEIRDALVERREGVLETFLDPRVAPLVKERFELRWKELRSA